VEAGGRSGLPRPARPARRGVVRPPAPRAQARPPPPRIARALARALRCEVSQGALSFGGKATPYGRAGGVSRSGPGVRLARARAAFPVRVCARCALALFTAIARDVRFCPVLPGIARLRGAKAQKSTETGNGLPLNARFCPVLPGSAGGVGGGTAFGRLGARGGRSSVRQNPRPAPRPPREMQRAQRGDALHAPPPHGPSLPPTGGRRGGGIGGFDAATGGHGRGHGWPSGWPWVASACSA